MEFHNHLVTDFQTVGVSTSLSNLFCLTNQSNLHDHLKKSLQNSANISLVRVGDPLKTSKWS